MLMQNRYFRYGTRYGGYGFRFYLGRDFMVEEFLGRDAVKLMECAIYIMLSST